MKCKTLLSLFIVTIMFGCCADQQEKIVEKEVIKEVEVEKEVVVEVEKEVIKEVEVEKEVFVERTTLQNLIDTANEGDIIDLSKCENITNYTATVNKQLTIKNGALKNAMLTVEADNVELVGLKDLKLTTSAELGSGSLTIRDSKLSDLLLLGGWKQFCVYIGYKYSRKSDYELQRRKNIVW